VLTSLRLNALVNLNGRPNKWIAIDEFNEWVIRAIKSVYNPCGSFQSTNFTCDIISRNIISFRQVILNIHKSSGAPTWGTKKSRVNDSYDVKAILATLVNEKVFRFAPGRVEAGPAGAPIRIKESLDLYRDGADAICAGEVLRKYVARKKAAVEGGLVDEEDDDEEDGVRNFMNELIDDEFNDPLLELLGGDT
jgi:hypothetical protein